jgi:hypothetical protein
MKKKAPRTKPPVNVAGILPADWLTAVDPHFPKCGLGMDVGTTTNQKSNPCVLVLSQKVGHEVRFPLVVRWKSKDPEVAKAIIRAVIDGLATIGLRARKLCIDATNERYFAVGIRSAFSGKLPVTLIVSSEKTEYMGEEMLWKAYLGNLLVNLFEDGYGALPSEPWVKTDIRSVVTEKGTFSAEVVEDGGHGDVFDGCKLALHAVEGKGGPAEAAGAATGNTGAGRAPVRAGIKNPFASKFQSGTRTRRAI